MNRKSGRKTDNFHSADGQTLDFRELNILRERLLKRIPEAFFTEIENYCEKNAITISLEVNGVKHNMRKICLRCLKGFIIAKARERNLSIRTMAVLCEDLKCRNGHNNYYLDSGSVRTILSH